MHLEREPRTLHRRRKTDRMGLATGRITETPSRSRNRDRARGDGRTRRHRTEAVRALMQPRTQRAQQSL
jgi:hypothetical protein